MRTGQRGRRRKLSSIVSLSVASLLFLGWCGWFVERTSFFVQGERHFVLFDDAMVSMTYARNLVEGHGLNWAREGEPVEGFTSPLWTLLMVPVNVVGIDLRLRSAFVQLLSLSLLVGNLLLVRRLSIRFFLCKGPMTWFPAILLTATYYSLNYWALMGMETGLQALLVTAIVFLAFEIIEGGRRRVISLWVLATAAYMTRMDMLILVAVVVGYIALRGAIRRVDLSRWILGVTLFILVAGGYQLFRWWYFGELLPNTYYLKLTGVDLEIRLLRGFLVYLDFLKSFWPVLAVVIAGLVGIPALRARARLPLALFLAYSAYSIYVGGDGWEYQEYVTANRFLVFVLPLVFVVYGALVASLHQLILDRFGGRPPALRRSLRGGLAITTLALTLFVNGLILSTGQNQHWRLFLMRDRPMLVGSHAEVMAKLKKLDTLIPKDARVATFWAGIPAYFSDYRMVDMFGYSDYHVARMPVVRKLSTASAREFRPGHMKWNYTYTFEEKKPDAFLQAWNLGERADAVMAARGFEFTDDFWVRRELGSGSMAR